MFADKIGYVLFYFSRIEAWPSVLSTASEGQLSVLYVSVFSLKKAVLCKCSFIDAQQLPIKKHDHSNSNN